ncbi:hypothetical protein OH77DRAFT_1392427 [Trametes cingulata]|nr:hypothetical protein OH77DRAFT_1392427 [Trametes cingulata]
MSAHCKGPKTPTSSMKLGLQDPETTPTRKRPGRQPRTSDTFPRRNSFEEVEVNSLPDPRTPEHISFQDVWTGPYLEFSRNAVIEFLPALERMLVCENRYSDYDRFFNMLRANARHASIDLERILEEACLLFGRHAELVHAFNDILPPGYRMETFPDYVAVFTPCGGWSEYPGRIRVYHPVIPSSSPRSPRR